MKSEHKWIVGMILIASAILLMTGSLFQAHSETGKGDKGISPESGINPAGQFPISDKPIVLTAFAAPPVVVENLNTNTFTKYLEEKLNVKFEFVIASAAAKKERKQMLFASGDYPAIILNGDLTPDEQINYGKSGILKPLNDLIDRYGDNIKRIFAEKPILRQAITAPDGQIYSLPAINECFHCWYAQKLWINMDWLNKLHLAPPETTEEFYQVLKAFKTRDPNGNGKADEIPLSGATDSWHAKITGFLMSAFIYNTDDNYFYMQDGKVGLAAAQPEWKEGLAYIRRLYSEGLIDPSSFTQTIDGLIQLASHSGDNVLGSAALGHIRMAFSGMDEERNKAYHTIPPLIGPNGYQAAGYFNTVENGQFAITDKATETEAAAAIRLADFLYSEEAAIRNEFGPENLWWRKGKPGEVDEHGRPAKYKVNPEYFGHLTQNEGWSQMGISYRDRGLRESWAVPQDPYSMEGYEHRLYGETARNYAGKEPEEVFPAHVYVEQGSAVEAARLRVQINDYIESAMVQFITGSKNIEQEWDAYLEGFNGLKLDRYLSIYQTAYDNYKRNP
ncbi:extracellular solute-binding protein [Paenibacillus alkaliterrae]|uniref:extracellular solute-binding protein n=1 Tax=Paenibacillus alkaliterrae TaxID=320909 RepID=UPI001F2FD984|nr:extracellular solute-binding protein [Paenibacillus alkaliterrae]MCF2937202.1 extracellular solute-binding protein [Paenibacillus alkaliterrae]